MLMYSTGAHSEISLLGYCLSEQGRAVSFSSPVGDEHCRTPCTTNERGPHQRVAND